MNTKKKAVYTMIGGLLIKNVPHYAKKIKILSNGSIIAVEKSGNESFIYSPSPSINHDYDKYSFVVFDVPPLAPCFEVGSALGFDSFGEGVPPFDKSSGGIVETGKNYVVGETPLTTEIPKVSTESIDVTEVQHENKKSLNILNLTFDSGSKLSDVLNMVESEIQNSGCNVTDNISSMGINEFRKHISDIVKDNIYSVSQKIATHVYSEEYNSSDVTLWVNELTKLESLMRKITHGGDIRLSVIS